MNYQNSYYSIGCGTTALKICHNTEHEKVGEHPSYFTFTKNALHSIVLLKQMVNSKLNYQRSYYTVSFGAIAQKLCHGPERQKVQHI